MSHRVQAEEIVTSVSRMREWHSHVLTDASKIDEVERVAEIYQALVRETVRKYWGFAHLKMVLDWPREAVNARRRSGEAAAYPLASHYQAPAVLEGLEIVRASWGRAFAAARSAAVAKYPPGAERHEVNWLLHWPTHLAAILDGKTIVPVDKEGRPLEGMLRNDHVQIDRWLARTLRAARAKQPRLRHRLAFRAEPDLSVIREREKGAFRFWISLGGLTRGKPIRIPMAGDKNELAGLSGSKVVSIVADIHGRRRLVFRQMIQIPVTPRTGGSVGLDKGIRNAIVATASDPEHALSIVPVVGDILEKRSLRSVRRRRSQLMEYADRLSGRRVRGRWHGNPASTEHERRAAARIRRRNLGDKRRKAEVRRGRAEIANANGLAARILIEVFPDATDFYEEKLNFQTANRTKGKDARRKLNYWAKADLSHKIALHVSASGARRKFVNAAYTSQACPRCSWTDRSNRDQQAFLCSHCGYSGHADAVASSNVRNRGSDRTIALFTPHAVVKDILLARHATTDCRCQSRGLNQGDPTRVLVDVLTDQLP